MAPLVLLALFSGLVLSMWNSSDDEDEVLETPETPEEPETPVDPITPETPEEPEVIGDTGATFAQTANGVEIDVGEDETGSLAVIYYTDTEDNADDFVQVDEARYYLVPEGVDWSDASWETQSDVPGGSDHVGGPYSYELADFEEHFGLELLGVVDLKGITSETDDPADRVGEITSNEPIEGYYLEANTDGDELVSFLPQDYVVTRGGVPELPVFQNTVGTDGTDWLSADADGIIVDGAGGDDFLETANANVTLMGGAGDDVIDSLGDGLIDETNTNAVVVDGGAGDDFINANTATVWGGSGEDNITVMQGIARGGRGDDNVTTYGGATVHGNAGTDRVFAYGEGSEAHGDAGDDFIGIGNLAAGFGGAGNDVFQIDAGATADGGSGDDLLNVWDFFDSEDGPAVVTGGEGADTIDVLIRNAGGGEAANNFLNVTDFDPAEDVLQIGSWDTQYPVDEVDIIEAQDGSYTDLRVSFLNTGGGYDGLPGSTIIRLEGTTGITANHFVITT